MANHVLLEKITLGATASSVTFNSIPQTGYTDLKVVVSARSTRGASDDGAVIRFNSSSTSFNVKQLYSTGSSAAATGGAYAGIGTFPAASSTASAFGSIEIYIPNYTSSSYKSYTSDSTMENNATYSEADLIGGLWSNTAAITSITIACGNGGNLAQYSTFSLYGISNAATTPVYAPMASGGDIIQSDGTYWYHAFLNGTKYFTPAKGLSCDILMIAGGGAGGIGDYGGGGGAGGLLTYSGQVLNSGTSYQIVVGAGGTGSRTSSVANGGNTTFTGLTTAIGGGGGGCYSPVAGAFNGGSGGGATGGYGNFGTGTSGQGYSGGTSTWYSAGGGGGSGGAGTEGNSSPSGYGGVGTTSAFLDSIGAVTNLGQLSSGHYYFAGGGGGDQGSPGLGGGISYVGGGGQSAANGASGCVVVRYRV